MKNRNLIIMIIVLSFFTLACSNNELKKDSNSEEINSTSGEESIENNLEVYSLRDELGIDYDKLSSAQIEVLSNIYDKINAFEFTDDNEDEYNELWYDFNSELSSMGMDIPFTSYVELADKYKDILSIKDYNRIIIIDELMYLSGDEAISDEEYEELGEELVTIFDKYDLSGKEIKTQAEMQNVQLALFDVRNGSITLSDDSIKKNLSVDELKLYQNFWKHVKTIIPNRYINMLTKFEINTDGLGNVMAHVIEEKEDLSVWRLAVDLKDSANSNGEFTSEFNNTIIHEFAHVITLNKSQMQISNIVDKSTFEVQEGVLKKEAYLNKFYEMFWKEIYKEHQDASNLDYENGMPSGGDAVYEFYEKYQDRFVSDYAATNPGEDIAEVYRVFVIEDKPSGSSIRDKKILFFYEMNEFVEIRDEIRKNLGL